MDEQIAQFAAITGSDGNTAKFYVESAGGDLEAAMSMYYESGSQSIPQPTQPSQQPQSQPRPLDARPPQQQAQPTARPAATTTRQPARSGNIATFSDFAASQAQGGEDSDSDEDRQRYYTGGSERSGQEVLDPHRKPKKDIVSDIFSKAKDMGAQSIDEFNAEKKKETFQGAGYRLGSSSAAPSAPLPETVKKERTVTLTFYRDGFTVDDGPFRRYDDPANQEFLAAINRGLVPREIMADDPRADVTVSLIDKKNEEYKPAPTKFNAFTGSGRSLSGGSSSTSTAASSKPAATSTIPRPTLNVNESEPVTTLQIRLADGTRLVAKFNHTHTIADIRNFVESAQTGGRNQNYDLSTTFPRKVLSDQNQTIADAGLLNAAIVQTLR